VSAQYRRDNKADDSDKDNDGTCKRNYNYRCNFFTFSSFNGSRSFHHQHLCVVL